jgi:hypothetical protein
MIAAAFRYFLIVFSVAFVLGTIRTLWLVPMLGATWAVICEIPIIIGISYVAARYVIRRYEVKTRRDALRVGAFAFAVLMIVESALAVLVFGESLAEWTASLFRIAGIIGLAGQMLFALMPALLVSKTPAADRHLP